MQEHSPNKTADRSLGGVDVVMGRGHEQTHIVIVQVARNLLAPPTHTNPTPSAHFTLTSPSLSSPSPPLLSCDSLSNCPRTGYPASRDMTPILLILVHVHCSTVVLLLCGRYDACSLWQGMTGLYVKDMRTGAIQSER